MSEVSDKAGKEAEEEEVEVEEEEEEVRKKAEEMVLPFEVASEDGDNILSMTREMEHLLDPLNKLRTPPPMIDLSPLECHALQMEEVEMLTAIYGTDLTRLNDQGTCFLVNVKFLSDEIKDDDVIRIWFSLPASYPSVPPIFEIESNTSGSFTFSDADNLFDLLMGESANRVGHTMIFDLVTIAQDYIPGLIEKKKVESERREAEEKERMERLQLEEALDDRKKNTSLPNKVVCDEDEEEDEEEEEDEDYPINKWGKKKKRGGGVPLDDIVFKPVHFVGSISKVLSQFPDHIQILRIENVLRQDLAQRFHRCRQAMNSSLADQERKNPNMYNLQTHIAFHGTLTRTLPSIVERGLVIPGSGNSVRVRCGSSLGVGIYLSPSPTFSLSYTDSNRLVVCAAIQGRIYQYGSVVSGRFHSSYNSLVYGEEWVFFNAAQVLPCYVVEVKEGPVKPHKSYNPPPLASLQDSSSSSSLSAAGRAEETDEQRKLRLAARARKFLPYGFGPGTQTVILDVASIDEDEEDYGDYQLLRSTQDEGENDYHPTGGDVRKSYELQEYRYSTPSKKL